MIYAIPRGIIYRTLFQELKFLYNSIFFRIDDSSIVEKSEKLFARYNQSKFCVAFSYARTAFLTILKYHKFKKGDEVILPPIQIKPMLEIVLSLGLKPVIVDIEPETLSFDLNILQRKINSRTKVILLTYLYGVVPNIDKLKKIIKNKAIIVEDFSQCLNGKFKNKKVGNFGDYGIYSGSATKTLDTYGGGFLFLKNKRLYDDFKKIQKSFYSFDRLFLIKKVLLSFYRNILTNRVIFSFITFNLINVIKLFYPAFNTQYLGKRNLYVSKNNISKNWLTSFTSLQAYYLLNRIKKISFEDQIRIENCNKIIKLAKYNHFPKKNYYSKNVYWQLLYQSKNKKKLEKKFREKKIDTATPSIILYSNLKNLKNKIHTPVANKIYNNSLFIPSYHILSQEELSRVIAVLKSE